MVLSSFIASCLLFVGFAAEEGGDVLKPWAPVEPFRPPLREEVSLNGTWDFTPKGKKRGRIPVPEYWDAAPGYETDTGTYEREVRVPAKWVGKIVRLDFEGVLHSADVFVNGRRIHTHVGGWIPFSVDVPDDVKPGSTFDLKVVVRGGNQPPIQKTRLASPGKRMSANWPVGWWGDRSRWGIVHPVWLRAYGRVCIEDAFIRTSFRKKLLTVEYTLANHDGRSRTVALSADVLEAKRKNPGVAHRPEPLRVKLAAGETKTITVKSAWKDPHLWMPDAPYLYVLRSRLVEGESVVDEEARRFGFREIWTKGNQFILNGVRANLMGTSSHLHCQSYQKERYRYQTPESWPETVDTLLSLNIRILRHHMCPTPRWVLDVSDEKGLMIIEESAIYGSFWHFDSQADKDRYTANCRKWIEPWVRDRRNHPSIVIWSAENENATWYGGAKYTTAELMAFGKMIREHDTTRPITYDGDRVPDSTFNLHYPEGYMVEPKGSIYSWCGQVRDDLPTGIGEFITHYTSHENVYDRDAAVRHHWWQGTWCRGLRYCNFTDVRPYTMMWTLDDPKSAKARNVKNSFAPVALFDKDYDDWGIDPLLYKTYPMIVAGRTERRTLVLYNDEFRGDTVTVKVRVKSGKKVHARLDRKVKLELGEHVEIPFSFKVPAIAGKDLDMVLSTSKDDVKKFEERKRFTVVAGPVK